MGTWSLLVVLLISCAASLAKKCPSNILMKFLSNPSKAKEHYDNGETISVTCLADSGEDGYDYSNDDGSDGLDTNNIRVLNCTDGKWIGHYPECFSNCTKPDIFAILNPEYEVYAPGDNVTITACKKDNARIEGDTTLICMADGTWIGSARCPKQHRSCNKQPPTISNVYITDAVLDEYKHGTVLRYKCSQAFDQLEKYSVTCNDGQWIPDSANLIRCIKKCPSNILKKFLSDPSKAKEHYDNGETVSVTCLDDSGDDGYDYSNYDGSDGMDTKIIRVLKCTDGKWIGHYPECFSNCSKPDIYAILNPEYEVYTPGDNVTITACKKDNAKIEGDTTLICMADGTWIGSARCPKQHRSCNKHPPTISNAYITDAVLDEYKHGTVMRYKCSQTFDQMVKHSVTCNDGQWIPDSANLTICIIGHCSHIDSREIGNMRVKKISGQVGTYAEFECYDGYELDGSAKILCMADRKWYPEIPKCKPISCPPPKQILNGRLIQEAYNGLLNIYESTIRYDCDMGYMIDGPRFRKCQSDRTWSGNDTKCEEIVCEKPSPPENGKVYFTDNSQKVGSQIEYICDEHHIMEPIASKFAICTVHGNWSSPQPRCIKICKVRALSHGSIQDISGRKITENSYVLDNTELIFTCYNGYEKYAGGYEPRGLLQCVYGALRPGSPECRPQRCFIEPTTNLEYFIGQEKVLGNYIHSGIVMNVQCSNRTELFRSSSYLEREQVYVKCSLGKLEPQSPVCKDKRCNIITAIDNGHFRNTWKVLVTGEKIQSGTYIQLKCSEGYELYNKTNSMYLKLVQTDIKCYQGSFTIDIPSCEPTKTAMRRT